MMRHGTAALLLLATVVGALHALGSFVPARNLLWQARAELAPRAPTGQIVVVEIDAKSLSALGQWPWPRRIHADLVRKLAGLGAAEIAFDVDFSSRSSDADDLAFEEALKEANGGVVLAAFTQRLTGAPHETRSVSTRPLERLREHAWEASVNVLPDPDGTVRTYPSSVVLGGEEVPSLGATLAGVRQTRGPFLVDYSIAAGALTHVSAVDLLEGRVPSSAIAGRKAIVGATAVELRDYFHVPVHGLVPGVVLQALAAETLIQGRALAPTNLFVTALGLLVLTLAALQASRRLRWRGLVVLAAGLGLSIEAAAHMIQATTPLALDTPAWHALLLGVAGWSVLREIDMSRVLLAISTAQGQNTQALLGQIITDNFDGIVVVDEEGTIQSASRAALEVLAAPGDDWIGRQASDLLPPALLTELRQSMKGDAAEDRQPRALTVSVGGATRTFEYVITLSRLSGVDADGRSRAGQRVACLTFRDITERRLAEKRLAYLARYDTLTGLPNRHHLVEHVSGALKRGDPCAALMLIDLDRFKTVNDTLGHHVGDLLLHEVARRGFELVPPPNLVARLGGDEFAVVYEGASSKEDLADLAARLIAQLSEPYEIGGSRLAVGASIGIVHLDGAAHDVSTAMRNADMALYQAKRAGGAGYRFFDASMNVAVQARQRLEVALRDALARDEFAVAYQPQVDLSTGTLVGVEALLRWEHPERGAVSPAEFVPVAEEIGLMEGLGEWVLQRACADAASWPMPIRLAVNVSPSQFTRGDLVASATRALELSSLPPEHLELEITESLFLQGDTTVKARMEALSRLGVSFALDDFGTGYSSLGYIRTFPIDKIKIDRSFVSGLPHDTEAVAIVQAVVALATGLGLRVNAEGVESEEQRKLLQLLGCNEGQGYGLGRPQSAAEIAAILAGQSAERLSA
jgi:diguanylate cyclase (GGDEF)-like protein/PAS domain S-box-containing protein